MYIYVVVYLFPRRPLILLHNTVIDYVNQPERYLRECSIAGYMPFQKMGLMIGKS